MPTENQPEPTFIVLSLKHTHRRHKAITLWRPNGSGYCWMLESAGIYGEDSVMERLSYYNSGCSNIAVPYELVKRLGGRHRVRHQRVRHLPVQQRQNMEAITCFSHLQT